MQGKAQMPLALPADLDAWQALASNGGAIAQALQAGMVDARAGAAERPFLIHGRWRRWRCGLAQGLAIPLLVLLFPQGLAGSVQWLGRRLARRGGGA